MRSIIITTIFACWHLSLAAQETLWFPIVPDQPTKWFYDVKPESAHQYYPRPTLKRQQWKSLNGKWQFALTDKYTVKPERYDKQILVPFPVESGLSGVGVPVNEDYVMWYKKRFFLPETWSQRFILLHINGSDWETKVYVNGKEVGLHRGGYDAFQFDITQYLNPSGIQEIEIAVFDPTDRGYQPHGAQSLMGAFEGRPSSSGIWQSVWLEPVLWESFKEVAFSTQRNGKITVQQLFYNQPKKDSIQYEVTFNNQKVLDTTMLCSDSAIFYIKKPNLWTPETPNLYHVEMSIKRGGLVLESIQSYFGIRQISVTQKNGRNVISLNGKPYFVNGVVDEGYWPGGIYTAPTKSAWVHELTEAKKMGFNAIKKYKKTEPDIWYYLCDSLGLLVNQEIPESTIPDEEDGAFKVLAQYKIELQKILSQHRKFTCIYQWNPFPDKVQSQYIQDILASTLDMDQSRLIGIATEDTIGYAPIVREYQYYNRTIHQPKLTHNVWAAGKYGGAFLVIPQQKNAYKPNKKELKTFQESFESWQNSMKEKWSLGLSAAFYYQLTDTKHEKSGLITFDRKFNKATE